MRIGIDGRLWNETGVGRYIRNLVYSLQKIDTENEYVLFVKSLGDISISHPKWRIVEANIAWHTLAEQTKLPRILDKENLDLMHFPYFSVPIRYKKPYVVTVHDLIIYHHATGKASTLPLPFYYAKRIGYKYILRKAVVNAEKILVPLDTIKDDVVNTFGVDSKKIVVTREGVDKKVARSTLLTKAQDHEKQEASLDKKTSLYFIQNTRYFLYVGNAYPHKNVEFLIDTFHEFHKENKDIKLVLVGKEDYFYKRLKKKVQSMNLQGSVHFEENVSDEQLATFYAHAIAFISLSLMEGFGLPPLEALANKCPVIVSANPAFKEVCGDAAFYVQPKDKEDILEKMRIVMEINVIEKDKMLASGEKRVKQFSWEKMAEQTLEVYESVEKTSGKKEFIN